MDRFLDSCAVPCKIVFMILAAVAKSHPPTAQLPHPFPDPHHGLPRGQHRILPVFPRPYRPVDQHRDLHLYQQEFQLPILPPNPLASHLWLRRRVLPPIQALIQLVVRLWNLPRNLLVHHHRHHQFPLPTLQRINMPARVPQQLTRMIFDWTEETLEEDGGCVMIRKTMNFPPRTNGTMHQILAYQNKAKN